MDPVTASLIGSGLQTGSNVGASVLNYISAQQQRKWSEDMMNQQNAWNLEQWNRQNEWDLNMWNKTNAYNTPSAQVERMKAAGLNPLYYGLDGSSANGMQTNALESASPTPYERASFQGFGNPLAGYADAKVKEAQIDNINADTALKTHKSKTEVEYQQNLRKERDEMDARIDNLKSSSKLNDKEREKIEQYMLFASDIYQAAIDKDKAAAGLSNAQKDRIESLLPGELELQKMSAENFRQQWNKWNAEIGHMAAQDAVLAKQSKYYLLSLLTSGVYGSGISAVNALITKYIMSDPDLSEKEKDDLITTFTGVDKDKPTKVNFKDDKTEEHWVGLTGHTPKHPYEEPRISR